MAQLPLSEQFRWAEEVPDDYLSGILQTPPDSGQPVGQLAALATLNQRESVPGNVNAPPATVKDQVLARAQGSPMPPQAMPPQGYGHGGVVSHRRGFDEGTGAGTVSAEDEDEWTDLIFDPDDPWDYVAAGLTASGIGAGAGLGLKSLNVLRKARNFLPGGGVRSAIKQGWDRVGGAAGRVLGAGRSQPRTIPTPYSPPITNPYRVALERAAGKRGLKIGGAGLGLYAANRMGSGETPVGVPEVAEAVPDPARVTTPGGVQGIPREDPAYLQYLEDMFTQDASVDDTSRNLMGGITPEMGLAGAAALIAPGDPQQNLSNFFAQMSAMGIQNEDRDWRQTQELNKQKLQAALGIMREQGDRDRASERAYWNMARMEQSFNEGLIEYVSDRIDALREQGVDIEDPMVLAAYRNRFEQEYMSAMNAGPVADRSSLDVAQGAARGGLIRGTLEV